MAATLEPCIMVLGPPVIHSRRLPAPARVDQSPLARAGAGPAHSYSSAMTPCPTVPLISIVDDDLSVRRALRRLVQSASYAVDTFASAREFLDASPFARPACLVLDLCLGG